MKVMAALLKYKSEIGVLLNVDKDHKDLPELMQLFTQFKNNSKSFIVNQNNKLAATLSAKYKAGFFN